MRSCNFLRMIYNKVTLRSYDYFLKFSYFFQSCQKLQSLVKNHKEFYGLISYHYIIILSYSFVYKLITIFLFIMLADTRNYRSNLCPIPRHVDSPMFTCTTSCSPGKEWIGNISVTMEDEMRWREHCMDNFTLLFFLCNMQRKNEDNIVKQICLMQMYERMGFDTWDALC